MTLGQANAMGSVGGTGGAVAITSAGGIALDATNAASLALASGGNADITQNAAAS